MGKAAKIRREVGRVERGNDVRSFAGFFHLFQISLAGMLHRKREKKRVDESYGQQANEPQINPRLNILYSSQKYRNLSSNESPS